MKVDHFVIMPNHIQGIIIIDNDVDANVDVNAGVTHEITMKKMDTF